MAAQPHKPHFLLFPLMAQGHMIPMVDLAKMLAHHGAIVTIVTTPHNAARFETFLARATKSGLQIRVVKLQFPCEEAGLPKGCENMDLLPSLDSGITFFNATYRLYDSSEKMFEELSPQPSCIISDMCLPWTTRVARKYHIPRIVFYSLCSLFLLCMWSLKNNADSEYVHLSGLSNEVKFSKSLLPLPTDEENAKFAYEMAKANQASYGVIINTIEEMEPEYVKEFKRIAIRNKVWCIGPVSLCNKDKLDTTQRGDKASIDEFECIEWLDRQQTCSVVYTSFGSLCNLPTAQIIELGFGLEASKKPFIWVIRQGNVTEELRKWVIEYDFEERIKGRGLVIYGWAPQVLILSHPAIGGFLTHCGWNSTIEAISAGVTMITWPLFADQVFNEKVILEILKIGVSVGKETCLEKEKKGVLVKKEDVKEAIDCLMDGDEREERRERCKELAEIAKRAVEEGGSSHANLKLLIEDIVHQSGCRHVAS